MNIWHIFENSWCTADAIFLHIWQNTRRRTSRSIDNLVHVMIIYDRLFDTRSISYAYLREQKKKETCQRWQFGARDDYLTHNNWHTYKANCENTIEEGDLSTSSLTHAVLPLMEAALKGFTISTWRNRPVRHNRGWEERHCHLSKAELNRQPWKWK